VYSPNWTALEELLLLQGIERYGIDNWNTISDNIATKTPKECNAHYYTYYYKSRNDCCPNNCTDIISIRNSEKKVEIIEERSRKAEEKLAQYISKQESSHEDSPDKGTAESNDTIGYNPFREEFSIEYDNEAEFLISDLTFLEEDTTEERQIKYDLIDLYQKRLQNRIKVRKFIIDRGLNDSKKLQINDKRKSKKGKEISQRLKKCMLFMGKGEYDSLIYTLSEEAEIQKQLQEYTYYQ
jgi:transcriptional adapter 2-alpha